MSSKLPDILNYLEREFTIYHFGLLVLAFLSLTLGTKSSKEFRRILPLCLYWVLSEFFSLVLAVLIGSNGPAHHVYAIVFYLLAVYYYYPQLKDEKGMKLFFLSSSLGLIVFGILNALRFQSIYIMPTNTIMVGCLFLLFLAFSCFKQMLANPISTPLRLQSRFWISTALFVFYSWAFFFFSSHAYFLQRASYPKAFARIPDLFSFVMLILFCIAFIAELKSRQEKYESNLQ